MRSLAVAVAAMCSFVFGAQASDANLAGSDWVSSVPGCDIREISFTGDTAIITMAWDSGSAHWKSSGNQIAFDLDDWDGKLAGVLKSDDELDLDFTWTTADYMPHRASCALHKKQ